MGEDVFWEFDAGAMGKRIQLLRKDQGLRQDELAETVGIHRAYISQLELGRADNPTLKIIWALANALKVNPAYILGIDEDPGFVVDSIEDLPDDVMEIVRESMGLDPENRASLLGIARALKITAQTRREKMAVRLEDQRELLQSLYDVGGKDALLRFFALAGFTVPNEGIEDIAIRYGLTLH